MIPIKNRNVVKVRFLSKKPVMDSPAALVEVLLFNLRPKLEAHIFLQVRFIHSASKMKKFFKISFVLEC